MENSIISVVSKLSEKCNSLEQSIMQKLNLSTSEYQFLTRIKYCTSLNSNEIASAMGLSLSRVSRIVEKLVQHGYLCRTANKTDRRAITLCITKEGEQVQEEINFKKKQCEIELLQQITDEEQKLFKLIAEKMLSDK